MVKEAILALVPIVEEMLVGCPHQAKAQNKHQIWSAPGRRAGQSWLWSMPTGRRASGRDGL